MADDKKYSAEEIEKALTERLQATHVNVEDNSGGCGASFVLHLVVSTQFEGKKPLEKHRIVNGALAEEMKTIHAFSIKKCITPAQHQNL
mmetsp:Transcript_27682/g.46352  ORF Transcript_27682/g.46352 Transcript_27682/m.46352 type:complete len:89 (+) Transcript_27682:143-409(+)